jgi:AhpD family alkylhydroperoxidase
MIATKTRIASRDVKKFIPGFGPAIGALADSAAPAGLEPELINLIYLRVSQINGCAYCVQSHISDLQEMQAAPAKINLVVAWEEAGIFSEREEAAFAWAEALTLIAEDHVPDAAFAAVREHFSEQEIVGLTAHICAINCWNRMAVSFRYAPEI